MKFSVSEYVRWEDIDAAGIINYQAYLRFFGLAEVELFRSCGLSYRRLFDELHVWLPRVHVECDFFHPVTLVEDVSDSLGGHRTALKGLGERGIDSSRTTGCSVPTGFQLAGGRIGDRQKIRHAAITTSDAARTIACCRR